MTGLLCAVLGGAPEMIRTLVELKADVHSRAWGLSEFGYYDSQTLLMVACKSSQEPSMRALVTLIVGVCFAYSNSPLQQYETHRVLKHTVR